MLYTGLDYGQDNILSAQNHASLEKVSHLTTFRKGDAEVLPFEDGNLVIRNLLVKDYPIILRLSP